MEKADFLKAQFETLRDEIKETKARIFWILSMGVILIPAAQTVGARYELGFALLGLPIIIIVYALLYLAENHALMRCGSYIRTQVEEAVPEVIGWE